MKLGKLEEVDIKQVWSDEARDFTPWLASPEGLTLLGETLDLELELVGKEEPVGPFRADVLARAVGAEEEHLIVIENQFGKTNHDHLGKNLTYAAGLKAATVIWISENFTDEHRQALDWLNEIAGENASFFGLRIHVRKIGGSDPAPQFEIVSSPNDWAKAVAVGKTGAPETATKLDQQKFWQELREYAKQKGSKLSLRKPLPQHWYSCSVGRAGFDISLTVNSTKKRVGCELYFNTEPTKAAFDLLLKDKGQIEAEIGSPLEWQRLDGKKSSRIALYTQTWIDDPLQRQEATKWLLEKAERFHTAFSKRVKDLNLENDAATEGDSTQ